MSVESASWRFQQTSSIQLSSYAFPTRILLLPNDVLTGVAYEHEVWQRQVATWFPLHPSLQRASKRCGVGRSPSTDNLTRDFKLYPHSQLRQHVSPRASDSSEASPSTVSIARVSTRSSHYRRGYDAWLTWFTAQQTFDVYSTKTLIIR